MEPSNRRQFERLVLTDRAVAVDSAGTQLGNVRLVGGGGILVCDCRADVLGQMEVGRKMRVTIVEPDLGTTNIMDVEVRYVRDGDVGMQFVSFK